MEGSNKMTRLIKIDSSMIKNDKIISFSSLNKQYRVSSITSSSSDDCSSTSSYDNSSPSTSQRSIKSRIGGPSVKQISLV